MSGPREILPNSFYLLNRRCTQRMFLLRPDDETNNAFRLHLLPRRRGAALCATTRTGVCFVHESRARRTPTDTDWPKDGRFV
jgi:hypothetical protein